MLINLFLNSIFIIFILLLTLIICESSIEKSEKQLKYDACYKLVQSHADQDREHFKELSSELKPEEVNNILQYSLFDCYQNIDYYDAEFIDEKNIKEINIYQDKYIDLLNFEKWEDLIRKKDEESIQYNVMNLQRAYKDIQSGEIKINRYAKKPNPKNRKINNDNMYEKTDDDDRFFMPNDFDGDFELFGFNFSKLSPKFKNIVGFGLILLVFICIIIGLRWIQNIREQNTNKKKKNKKEKKK
jgi:hypothetical protein